MKFYKTWLLFCITFYAQNSAIAQSAGLGSWNILNVKYNYNKTWSYFAESQLRSLKFYNEFHYYEIKGGANYKTDKNITFTLGAGTYQTYKEGGNFSLPQNNNEFRIWPQITLFQTVGILNFEQRYRVESRFTSSGYKNRFRYRLGMSYQFGEKINNYNRFQISASNELFFTNSEPYFERNRFLVAINYKPSKASTIQLGYLNQFDYKINDETGRDFFQIGYYIELFRQPQNNIKHKFELNDN